MGVGVITPGKTEVGVAVGVLVGTIHGLFTLPLLGTCKQNEIDSKDDLPQEISTWDALYKNTSISCCSLSISLTLSPELLKTEFVISTVKYP